MIEMLISYGYMKAGSAYVIIDFDLEASLSAVSGF